MATRGGLLAGMRRNLAKPFSIGGVVLAEVYMLYTVLAPYRKGPPLPLAMPLPVEPTAIGSAPIPLDALLLKLAVGAVFFGMFGALVGVGIGILISGLLGHFRSSAATDVPGGEHRD